MEASGLSPERIFATASNWLASAAIFASELWNEVSIGGLGWIKVPCLPSSFHHHSNLSALCTDVQAGPLLGAAFGMLGGGVAPGGRRKHAAEAALLAATEMLSAAFVVFQGGTMEPGVAMRCVGGLPLATALF